MSDAVDVVHRMIGIVIGIESTSERGVRSLNELEDLASLGDDLSAVCQELYGVVRSGNIPEAWRSVTVVPWRGPVNE